MKIGLFTDTLEDINGVARFIRDIGQHARQVGRDLVIHTSMPGPKIADPPFARQNFDPLVSSKLPYYPQLSVSLPPAWQMLHWAEQQRFDIIHCSTPGPVGLCGWMIARWLKLPLAATYHTDFPAYTQRLTGSRLVAGGTALFMKLFYRRAQLVFSRSGEYERILVGLGVPPSNLRTIRPAINLGKFNPSYRDASVWERIGVKEPIKLLYIGRVSVEKNLPMLVEAYRRLCARRRDIAWVVVGEGPYERPIRAALSGLPAYVTGVMGDRDLARMYASADLFVFPSRTDTLGQVVMESQACGLPALVSDQGGPKTIVQDGLTGRVVPGNDPDTWACAIEALIDDAVTRRSMSAAAIDRLSTFRFTDTFEHFWSEHESAVARWRARRGPATPGPAVTPPLVTPTPLAGVAPV